MYLPLYILEEGPPLEVVLAILASIWHDLDYILTPSVTILTPLGHNFGIFGHTLSLSGHPVDWRECSHRHWGPLARPVTPRGTSMC